MKYADGLRNMLASYHKVLSSLDDAEVGRDICHDHFRTNLIFRIITSAKQVM